MQVVVVVVHILEPELVEQEAAVVVEMAVIHLTAVAQGVLELSILEAVEAVEDQQVRSKAAQAALVLSSFS